VDLNPFYTGFKFRRAGHIDRWKSTPLPIQKLRSKVKKTRHGFKNRENQGQFTHQFNHFMLRNYRTDKLFVFSRCMTHDMITTTVIIVRVWLENKLRPIFWQKLWQRICKTSRCAK